MDQVLISTLTKYGVSHLRTMPLPYFWHYKRAEVFFLTKTWRVEYLDSVAAYEAVMRIACPLRSDFTHIPYLGDVVKFVKEQCRGQVGFFYPSDETSSTAWFSDLHDVMLYKLSFS